jgi:hypothetical protein
MTDAGVRVLPAISMLRDEEAARTEEDKMYPYTSRALAQERVRDLHADAARDQRARQIRLSRRARKAAVAEIRVPDSYEDFLCQTAEAAMREPTAASRGTGQAVR